MRVSSGLLMPLKRSEDSTVAIIFGVEHARRKFPPAISSCVRQYSSPKSCALYVAAGAIEKQYLILCQWFLCNPLKLQAKLISRSPSNMLVIGPLTDFPSINTHSCMLLLSLRPVPQSQWSSSSSSAIVTVRAVEFRRSLCVAYCCLAIKAYAA